MNDDEVIYVNVNVGGSTVPTAVIAALVQAQINSQLPAAIAAYLASLPIQGLN